MSKEEARKELAALSQRASSAEQAWNTALDQLIERHASQPKRKPSFGSLTWTELKKKRET